MTAGLVVERHYWTDGGHRSPLQEIEWEVLPPEEKRKRARGWSLFSNGSRSLWTKRMFCANASFHALSRLLTSIHAVTPARNWSLPSRLFKPRLGVPKILLARMSLNILINEFLGIVPVVGDAFSFWFKSNARNYQIIKDHTAAPNGVSRRNDWSFVIAVLVLLFGIDGCGLLVTFLLLREIAKLLADF
jgi:hypothetical protein